MKEKEYRITEKQLETLKKTFDAMCTAPGEIETKINEEYHDKGGKGDIELCGTLAVMFDDLNRELEYLIEDIENQPTDDWVKCVEEFNRGCGVARFGTRSPYPWPVVMDAIRLQLKLIEEETGELRTAYEDWILHDADQKEILDAVCDSIYVLIGLGYIMGFDLRGAFAEVHRSNMSKFGKDGQPVRRKDGKIMKSELFSPPNLEPFVNKRLDGEEERIKCGK